MPLTPESPATVEYYDRTTYWQLRLSEDGQNFIMSSEVDGEDYLVFPVAGCLHQDQPLVRGDK